MFEIPTLRRHKQGYATSLRACVNYKPGHLPSPQNYYFFLIKTQFKAPFHTEVSNTFTY